MAQIGESGKAFSGWGSERAKPPPGPSRGCLLYIEIINHNFLLLGESSLRLLKRLPTRIN